MLFELLSEIGWVFNWTTYAVDGGTPFVHSQGSCEFISESNCTTLGSQVCDDFCAAKFGADN